MMIKKVRKPKLNTKALEKEVDKILNEHLNQDYKESVKEEIMKQIKEYPAINKEEFLKKLEEKFIKSKNNAIKAAAEKIIEKYKINIENDLKRHGEWKGSINLYYNVFREKNMTDEERAILNLYIKLMKEEEEKKWN